MMVLGIDTATPICSVGLVEDNHFVADYRLLKGYSHAEKLPILVERIMEDGQKEISDVDGIAISIGPGSFTGLRIGVSFAKGLAFGWDKPLLAVPTMDGLMAALPHYTQWACVLLTARKGEFYRGFYQWLKEGWQPVGSVKTVLHKDVLKKLPNEPMTFLGEGALILQEEIVNQKKGTILPEYFIYPSGYGIGLKGSDLLNKGEIADFDQLVPIYIKRFQNVL